MSRAPRAASWVLGTALAALLLAACGPAPGSDDVRARAGDKLLVLTTFTVLADMVREVGGEHVHVESITKVGAEIHGYEPTPDDLRRAAEADLVIENGLGLEAWFADFTSGLDAPRVTLSDAITPVPVHGSATADDPGVPNPHAWMSPLVGATYAVVIGDALADADPEHAADYRAAAQRYADELGGLADTLTRAVAGLPDEQRLLVTCEGAFSYLARDTGLGEAYLWAVNSEQQATPRSMAAVVDAVRERDVPAVFCESTVPSGAQRQVADETGSRYAGELYVDSLSLPGGPVPTYLDLLTYDVTTIIDGLTVTTTTEEDS